MYAVEELMYVAFHPSPPPTRGTSLSPDTNVFNLSSTDWYFKMMNAGFLSSVIDARTNSSGEGLPFQDNQLDFTGDAADIKTEGSSLPKTNCSSSPGGEH